MSANPASTVAQDLLARYKRVTGLATNYGVAKRLGVAVNAVNTWQRGGGMDDTAALKIAEELQTDPFPIIARLRRDRAKTPAERNLWEKYCARVLVAALGALIAGHVPQQAHALTEPQLDTLYIMRRRLGGLRGLIPLLVSVSRTALRQRLRPFAIA